MAPHFSELPCPHLRRRGSPGLPGAPTSRGHLECHVGEEDIHTVAIAQSSLGVCVREGGEVGRGRGVGRGDRSHEGRKLF